MKEIIIRGVAMIPASEVYEAIGTLTQSRNLYREVAAKNGQAATAYEAQLDAIRAALHGGPDSDLVSLAAATYAGCQMFERLAGNGAVTREMIMRAVKGNGND